MKAIRITLSLPFIAFAYLSIGVLAIAGAAWIASSWVAVNLWGAE